MINKVNSQFQQPVKSIFLILLVSLLFTNFLFAQSTTISPGGAKFENKENANSIVVPKMSLTDILEISNPEKGAIILDTTSKCIRVFNGLRWNCVESTNDNGEIHLGDCNAYRINHAKNIYGIDNFADSSGAYIIYTTFDFVNISELLGDVFINISDTLGQPKNGIHVISTIADPLLRSIRVYVTKTSIYSLYSFCGLINVISGPAISPIGNKSDGLIIKHSKSGEFKWKKVFGGDENDAPVDLTFDQNENLYLTGYTDSPIFNMDTQNFSNTGLNTFISIIDSSGTTIQLKKIEGAGEVLPVELEIDPLNRDLILLGNFDNSVKFQSSDSTGIGSNSSFLMKLDTLLNEIDIEIIDSESSNDSIMALGFSFDPSSNLMQFAFQKSKFNNYFKNSLSSTSTYLCSSNGAFPISPINNLNISTTPNGSVKYRNGILGLRTYGDVYIGNKSFRNPKFVSDYILKSTWESEVDWLRIEGDVGVGVACFDQYNDNAYISYTGPGSVSLCNSIFNSIISQDVVTFENYLNQSLYFRSFIKP